MSESPLRWLREERSLTIDRVSAQTGLSKQFIIKAEQCVYNEPSETLIVFYEAGNIISEIRSKYYEYQKEQRKFSYGRLIEPWHFNLVDGSPNKTHPFRNWRVCSGVGSLSAFCKYFCVHPAVMSKFEVTPHRINTVPEQLTHALLESGYDAVTLRKLEEAYRDFLINLRGELTIVHTN